jgi:hypothetical protein
LRITWHSLAALVVLCGAESRAFDTISIDASLQHEKKTISGSLQVTFSDALNEATGQLRFRLYPNRFCESEDCGVRIDALEVNGRNITGSLTVQGTDAHAVLPESVDRTEPLATTVHFTTRVPEMPGRFGYHDHQYCLEAWFPMPAPQQDGRWLRIDYSENAEPVEEYYDFDVVFRLPDSLQVIAPGLTGADTADGMQAAEFSLTEAHEFPLLIASGYSVDSMRLNHTLVKMLHKGEDAFILDTLRFLIGETMTLMADWTFPYPYDEMIVVIGGFGRGGLELPRMVWLTQPPRVLGTWAYHLLVIHELIHQWFYGMINSNQAVDPWLDESVTEYLSWKVNRALCGDDPDLISQMGFSADLLTVKRLSARPYMDLAPIDLAADEYATDEYYQVLYAKGPLLIMTLTALMGPREEREFWREYAGTFRMRRPSAQDFFDLAGKRMPAGGTEQAAALLQMVAAPDFEMLEFASTRTNADSTSDEPVPGSDSSCSVSSIAYLARHPLSTPVTIRLIFEDGSVFDTTVMPDAGHNTLELERSLPVIGAVVDPDHVYVVDVNRLNNAVVPRVSEGAELRLFSGFTYLVELLFGALWGW